MKSRLIIVVSLFLLLVAACSPQQSTPAKAELPAGKAYANGNIIYFVHTEASDQGIADKLTKMMKSPVLFVPSLAGVPETALANVYVFTNGLAGSGPLGFQSDVFDNPPGSEGYSPLRRLNTVTWNNSGDVVELKSADEVLAAEKGGKIKIEQPGVVINMPFILWDGGKR